MSTNSGGGDEIHVTKHKLEIFNIRQNKMMEIDAGNVVYSYKDGFFETIESEVEDLPNYLFNSQLLSLHEKSKPEKFQIESMSYRSHDLIPLFGLGRWRENIYKTQWF